MLHIVKTPNRFTLSQESINAVKRCMEYWENIPIESITDDEVFERIRATKDARKCSFQDALEYNVF